MRDHSLRRDHRGRAPHGAGDDRAGSVFTAGGTDAIVARYRASQTT